MDKKEKTYWGVKESEIDDALLKKIIRYQRMVTIAIAIFLPVVVLNLVFQLCHKYINDTVSIVFSGIVIAVAVAIIVLYVIYIVNMVKLKKQVKQAQNSNDSKADDNTLNK